MRIAILGWGSLLWDPRCEFDCQRDSWKPDGPLLKLEFSRISKSRAGALTLVIDPADGVLCRVSHCQSKRKCLEDAVADLRCREGTTMKNIGNLELATGLVNGRDQTTNDTIRQWALTTSYEAVVWTDLPPKVAEEFGGKPYSVANAVNYLQKLDPIGKAKAAEYIFRAPEFIKTPLRDAVQTEPWFPKTP